MKLLDPSTTKVDALCDWAEVRAATSPRGDCTTSEIQQFIRIDDYDPENESLDDATLKDSERDERQAVDVIEHARERQKLLGPRYPFLVSDLGLAVNDLRNSRGELRPRKAAYLYHLLLSSIDSGYLALTDRHYFEVECAATLSAELGADDFHFGWTKFNSSLGKIKNRVQTLCKKTSLQWKPKDPIDVSYVDQNDVGVDIILWRKQLDSRENTLVFIGQCASGHNWDTKLASNAHEILADLLTERPSAPPVRIFCLPFVVPSWQWRRVTIDSQSIIFDRVRLVVASGDGSLHYSRNLNWVRRSLDRLTASR